MKNIFQIIFAILLMCSCTKQNSSDPSPVPPGGTGTSSEYQSSLYYQEAVGDTIQSRLAKGTSTDGDFIFGMKALLSIKGDTTLVGISWDVNDNGGGNWYFDTTITSSNDTIHWGGDPAIPEYYPYGPSYINSVKVIRNYHQDSLNYIKLVIARYFGGGYGDLRYQTYSIRKQPKAYHQCAVKVAGYYADPSSEIHKNAVLLGKLFDDK